MIRGKPKKIALGDGVNPAEAPPGYIAIKGGGDCHSCITTGSRTPCYFFSGDHLYHNHCTAGGAELMRCCAFTDRTDNKTVVYRKLTNDQG